MTEENTNQAPTESPDPQRLIDAAEAAGITPLEFATMVVENAVSLCAAAIDRQGGKPVVFQFIDEVSPLRMVVAREIADAEFEEVYEPGEGEEPGALILP